jgi:O-antigen/teichoic acid export membrane protein
LVEQSALSSVFGFTTLGIYTRAIGLAQITSGRIGPVAVQTLYPVLSRAEAGTKQFRRFSGLLYQGVVWTSFPAAGFLVLESERIVHLLYGSAWHGVVPLMAAAAVLLALRGVSQTLNSILLANLQQAICLRLDLIASLSSIAIVVAAVFYGPRVYLYALAAHAGGILGLTAYFGVRGGAIAKNDVPRVVGSCLAAVAVAATVHTITVGMLIPSGWPAGGLLVAAASLFTLVYVATLRLLSPVSFFDLLGALSLPPRVRGALAFLARAPKPSS